MYICLSFYLKIGDLKGFLDVNKDIKIRKR